MKIQKDTAVTLRIKISEATGQLLDNGKTPVVYLHGGYDNIFPKIEATLEGQEAGFQATLTLLPEDGFGQRDEGLLSSMPKKDFPPGVKLGGQLQGVNDAGAEQIYNVVKIKGDTVYLDGNHPLAGKTLRIALTVDAVRAASAQEIAHKHVHGEHGHHH
jgi:FKBP-type peptidyl-prolyl cis-trans isomerase SlyD